MKKNEEFLNGMDKISKGLDKIGSSDGGVIIKDSKYINIASNKIKKTKLSKTPEEARNEARFRNTKLGQPFNEEGTPPEEIDKSTSSLIDKYMEDILDQAFGID